MIRLLLIATMACLSVTAGPQAGGFQQLPMKNATYATFENYTLRLAEPDHAEKPTMWQGPLTISSPTGRCTVDVSLVTAIFGSPGRSFVVVVTISGSNTFAHFVELATCAEKWPQIKRAASGVTVAGNRLSFMPVCEGGGKNAPALCSSARVFLIEDDAAPSYLKSESYKLTARELGVGFLGEAKVMDARTPRAIIVH